MGRGAYRSFETQEFATSHIGPSEGKGTGKVEEVVPHWSFPTSFVPRKARMVAFLEAGWVERMDEEHAGVYRTLLTRELTSNSCRRHSTTSPQ